MELVPLINNFIQLLTHLHYHLTLSPYFDRLDIHLTHIVVLLVILIPDLLQKLFFLLLQLSRYIDYLLVELLFDIVFFLVNELVHYF